VKAILLAAGLGLRLRPLTNSIPKCLVPIQGHPLLEVWLDQLTRHGVESFRVNTHYLPDKVRECVAASPHRDKVSLVHEPELLGTAGTVWANREWIGNEPFMLIHADNLCLCDFSAFIQAHQARPARAVLTMMTFETTSPETCGIVGIDQEGMITAMHEKSPTANGTTANAAVYIAEPEILDFEDWSICPPLDFSTEVIPSLMGSIYAWENKGFHEDIGTLDKYNKSIQDVQRHVLWHCD
jgi:mannose-1-phosphate guanylyltransferase